MEICLHTLPNGEREIPAMSWIFSWRCIPGAWGGLGMTSAHPPGQAPCSGKQVALTGLSTLSFPSWHGEEPRTASGHSHSAHSGSSLGLETLSDVTNVLAYFGRTALGRSTLMLPLKICVCIFICNIYSLTYTAIGKAVGVNY